MEILQQLLDNVTSLIPTGVTVIAVIAVILIVRNVINRRSASSSGAAFRRQMMTLLLTFAGVIAIIIVLPISDSLRGQLLSLLGILITAAIALSATTFVGNIMAGLMLRAVRNFRAGDFIRVGDHFGRVSERGLFHVEIQTEDRDLTTMPNLYLVTNPVKVIRSSGTLITAEVSLGYDVPHGQTETVLTEAAAAAELQDPFVHVVDLGDYSVTYRVAGLLTDVKRFLTVRSRLRQEMLDKLHGAGIEIVSPTFMNQRVHPTERQFIPKMPTVPVEPPPAAAPEAIVFDKADEAESLEKLRQRHSDLGEELNALKEEADKTENLLDREKLQEKITAVEARRERLAAYIKEREAEK